MKIPPSTVSIGLLVLLAGAPCLEAQRGSQQRLIKQRQKKLSSAFLQKAAWQVDFDAAQAVAKRSKQYIFAYFTRSFAP